MNKLLIVLLAVCLVSVHAFVKRDAPAAPLSDITIEKLQNTFENVTKELTDIAAKVPEVVQKDLADLVQKAKDFIDKLKPTEEVKPEDKPEA